MKLELWCVSVLIVFFCFKQKTAYEMRISDWSSDVCSSDLPPTPGGIFEKMLKKRQLVVLNNAEDYEKQKFITLPGTDQSKSAVTVPIISSDRVIGTDRKSVV